MKNLYSFLAFFLICTYSNGQSVIYEDNFDSWNNGTFIGSASPDWDTWSGGLTDDANIVGEESHSFPYAIEMVNYNDIVFKCGNKTTGKYEISFFFYVKDGFGAYFNIEHEFKNVYASEIWLNDIGEIWFNNDKDSLKLGNYNHDTWQNFKFVFDLNNDSMWIALDENKLGSFLFSPSLDNKPSSTALDVIDFFGVSSAVNPAFGISASYWFIDDFKFTKLIPTSVNNLERIKTKLYPNPSTGNMLLSLPVSTDNYTVIVRNYLGQELKIYRKVIGEFEFFLEGYPGIYYIEVFKENERVEVFRVVKI